MIGPCASRPLCVILAGLLGGPWGFGQQPAARQTGIPVPPAQAAPLNIVVLEGNHAVNSISTLRSVAPIVEIHDENDFPVEGATVVFSLPEQGPGGAFAGAGASFTTRSDSHGQAVAPPIVPKLAGSFQITVTATAGTRKGTTVISQSNAEGPYSGPAVAGRKWYKRKLTWAVAGGVAAAVTVVLVVTHNSSSPAQPTGVVITTGVPVFH